MAVICSSVLLTRSLCEELDREGVSASLDGFLPNFFHGPGESPASRGDGRGVTSPIAVMIGLGTVELAAERGLNGLPKPAAFRLGVLDMGWSEEDDVLCCRFRFVCLEGVVGPWARSMVIGLCRWISV